MKLTGIDRVTFLVQDMDKAKAFFTNLFELDFWEETSALEEGGIRVCIGLPDGRVELISVVDAEKTAKVPFLKRTLELAQSGYQGPYAMCFSVKDGREAADDAKQRGVRIAEYFEGEHPGIVPPYKEAIFNEEDMAVPGIFVMSRHPK
ncbi:MAG: VOC family protein [Deltaproteobacteria bacterium]|nr:VOC family protein [Deltaproteobacteria bacterium]